MHRSSATFGCTTAVVMLTLAVLGSASAAAAPDPLRGAQWNLDMVRADEAHRIATGAGALVAVLDSGVDAAHPDLAGSVVNGLDFIDHDATPNDQHGHGTNVAGIIAAHAGNGIGIAGAAPGAKVLAIRVLDARNSGTTNQEADGIDAAVAAGAQVINLSLSAGPNVVTTILPGDPLVESIQRAARAGVVIVAAAGNDGVPLCAQPLLATKIICVGSVNRARARPSYSNYALRVDIVAPGGESRADEGIVSAQLGGGFSAMAGTSQATPHVAAAAALLVERGLRGAAVIERLEQTATDLGSPLQLGHGLLNMEAAVAGLGPPLPAAAPAEAAPVARAPRRLRLETVRSRGVRVVCTSPEAGTCRVRVTSRGRTIARGSRMVRAGAATTVRAKLTADGRRVLRGAGRLTASIRVTAPAGRTARLSTTFVP
jgi:subtilisin family serine protease